MVRRDLVAVFLVFVSLGLAGGDLRAFDFELPVIKIDPRPSLPPPNFGPPKGFAYEVEIGRVKTGIARDREERKRLEGLVREAEAGRVPYAGMRPEMVLRSCRADLKKIEARLKRNRERLADLEAKYALYLAREKKQAEKKDEEQAEEQDEERDEEGDDEQDDGGDEEREDESAERPAPLPILYVKGPVEVRRGGKWVAVDRETRLEKGDELRTGPKARLTFAVPGWGKQVTVKQLSRWKIDDLLFHEKNAGKLWHTVLFLLSGQFECFDFKGFRKNLDHSLEGTQLKLPIGVVGIRGTRFEVDLTKRGREIYRVHEGRIEVRIPGEGKVWSVTAGRRLVLQWGKAPLLEPLSGGQD